MSAAQRSSAPTAPVLTPEALAEVRAWLDKERAALPASVTDAMQLLLHIAEGMSKPDYQQRAMLTQLRRAMGITPSSERRRKKNTDGTKPPADRRSKSRDKLARLRHKLANAERRCDWHQERIRRQRKIIRDGTKRLMKLEDIALTAEEKAEVAAVTAHSMKNLELGGRCDLACAHAPETLMTGAGTHIQTLDIEANVDRLALKKDMTIKKELSEERRRLDFSFAITEVVVDVEKLVVARPSGHTEMVSGSLDAIGPPKMKVTWGFLISMAILVSQYAMPLNRFAGLVSSSLKKFTGGEMSRYFFYVARRFAPIYVALGRALANAPVLSGDDTPSRVLEVSRGLAERGAIKTTVTPWDAFSTRERARVALKAAGPDASLSVGAAAEFGFEFERKDGSGAKEGFNTAVLSGRTDIHNPLSTIIFYRSHLGGLGNLLDVILRHRRAELTDLVVQCDLSTVNLISDPALKQRLKVTIAGCAAHARRPFVHHESHDTTELVPTILHCFEGVFMYEKMLDDVGRNADNTLAMRAAAIRECWETLKQACELLQHKWSSKTPLGGAVRYVLRHYDKLTYYLADHRVGPSNNFSERMLRSEQLIENNALFRQTLNGRCALDIMRTVLQTAVAAKVDQREYLQWVLQTPEEVVAAAPAEYAPLAYAEHLARHATAGAQTDRTAA